MLLDREIIAMIRSARAPAFVAAHAVRVSSLRLDGVLRVPEPARCMVAFAHGSGSSRLSPRNNAVAEAFGRAGIATLLFDLLTEQEAADRHNVFDIDLLASRLGEAIAWLDGRDDVGQLPLGLFGASTGAAAALVAASEEAGRVGAVVSRGGRPDLAGAALSRVDAATLLIVGGNDAEVLALNRQAFARMHCVRALKIIPGATHLFEEPGALEQVAELGADWFLEQLRAPRT